MVHLRHLLSWLPSIAVPGIVAIAPIAIALSAQQPKAGETVIVISAPWQNALSLGLRAEGFPVGEGRTKSVAHVWSDDPEFVENLYSVGAWAVLSGDLAGLLCKPGGAYP